MTNFEQQKLKEFREKVNEVRREIPLQGDSKIHDFGYKTIRGDELFMVVDFGNIEKFLSATIKECEKSIIEELDNIFQRRDIPFVKKAGLVQDKIKELTIKNT